MSKPRPITLRGCPLAGGKLPAICAPLVGTNLDALLAELGVTLPKQPDLLEWRLDFFTDIHETKAVMRAAQAIQRHIHPLPLLVTHRSASEGGQPTTLTDAQLLTLYQALCQSGCIDLIDYEMAKPPAHIEQLRASAKNNRAALILSFHDFKQTPGLTALLDKFLLAEQLGADVAKVAVMPQHAGDMLTLLNATWQASTKLSIPLIGLAMGVHGAPSRLMGSAFGSALSFAVASASSAPGQLPIEDLILVRQIVQRATSH